MDANRTPEEVKRGFAIYFQSQKVHLLRPRRQDRLIAQNSDDLIYSDLQTTFSSEGHTVEINIYRLPETEWVLELVDEFNNSTVWGNCSRGCPIMIRPASSAYYEKAAFYPLW